MIFIKNLNDNSISVNGQVLTKVYQLRNNNIDNNVSMVNIYDPKDVIFDKVPFIEISINDVVADNMLNCLQAFEPLKKNFNSGGSAPLPTEFGKGQNYTYLDLTSADANDNCIKLQDEINRISILSDTNSIYGAALSLDNRFTIFATGKVVSNIELPSFIDLCSPAGFLEIENIVLSQQSSNNLTNVKLLTNKSFDILENSVFENCDFVNIDFVEGKNIKIFKTKFQFVNFSEINNLIMKNSESEEVNIFKGIIEINNCKVNTLTETGCLGFIYNSQISSYNVQSLKIRNCIDYNYDVIPNN